MPLSYRRIVGVRMQVPRRSSEQCAACPLSFFDLRLPETFDAALDGLVGRTLFGVAPEHTVHLLPRPRGNLKAIADANLGDSQHAFHFFNVALDLADEVVG